jgi:hypothetical protein
MTKSRLGGSVLKFFLACVAFAATASGQGWLGQGIVNRPDDSPDGQPAIAMDSSGSPWVVWIGADSEGLRYSRWLGGRWDDEKQVAPLPPGVAYQVRPSIAFDGQGRAWLVWDNAHENNSDDIGSRYWTGQGWSPDIQVNSPDSTDLNLAPYIACGGGQIWCVWYGGPTDTSHYTVFASHWNDSLGAWGTEMRVSPPDGNHHWWCDVAVDNSGTPHVVWCEVPHYLLYYSFYDGHAWTGPTTINDTTRVRASPWADPRIVIDCGGNLHVCYTGATRGASHRDIFYAEYDGTQWSESQKVTRDSFYDEWYSAIAADRPDNIWVTWDRQNEGPDQFRVHASHYDGMNWSPEARLDNDSSYYDAWTSVGLDRRGNPWVVWQGIYNGDTYPDIFFNRYGTSGIRNCAPLRQTGTARFVTVCPAASGLRIAYFLPASARVSLRICDQTGRFVKSLADNEIVSSGKHDAYWDMTDRHGRSASSGVYFCLLEGAGFRITCKLTAFARKS